MEWLDGIQICDTENGWRYNSGRNILRLLQKAFNVKKLNNKKLYVLYEVTISNRFATSEKVNGSANIINKVWVYHR